MPIYDFNCSTCQRPFSLEYKNFSAYTAATFHPCTHCGSQKTSRKIGRVAIAKGDNARLEALTDDSLLSSIDESDPVAVGRYMKKMSQAVGSDLGDSFDETVDQLRSNNTAATTQTEPLD